MPVPGDKIKRTRLIHTEKYVIAVEVEMVIPADDPTKPCYDAETVQLLKEIKEHAERGEENWLKQHGKVYATTKARPHYTEEELSAFMILPDVAKGLELSAFIDEFEQMIKEQRP